MAISTKFTRKILHGFIGGSVLFTVLSLPASAQVKTETSVVSEEPTMQATVERGEIVAIQGNNVVIKMEDGTLKDFHNVPESLTFMVDGKPVNIKTAKVGMKLQKQTITTTTPRVITTVETVTGKIWKVQAPNWVILTLEDGTNQRFNIPKGQMFTNKLSGKQMDSFGLKKGMVIDAQRVTEVPETLIAEQVKRTGKMPPPPTAAVIADIPILIVAVPAPAAPVETASAERAPTALPKTASELPLIGMLGAIISVISLISTAIRVSVSRYKELRS
jgi:RNase P/RNase MRP subunit p29